MSSQDTLSKDTLLALAIDCVNEADSVKADVLYRDLFSLLKHAHGDNDKQIAADLQMLAKELESRGLTGEAFQFKQRTCEVMLKISMEARIRSRGDRPPPASPAPQPTAPLSPSPSPPAPSQSSPAAQAKQAPPVQFSRISTQEDENWYADFFTGLTVEFCRAASSDEKIRQEVTLITDALNVRPPAHLIDTPCGPGRHASRLLKAGYRVTCVDVSDEMLYAAEKENDGNGSGVTFHRSDMSDFVRSSQFQGAFSLGNSFGYRTYENELLFLRNMSESLESGGRFLVNVSAAAECVLPHFKERDWVERGGVILIVSNSYSSSQSMIISDCTFIRQEDGTAERKRSYQHVYTFAEIERMLRQSNLKSLGILGDDGKEYRRSSGTAYLLCENAG